jgi:N12 class adenine-specific DNA methylase
MYRESEFTLKSDGRDPANALRETLKSQITPGTITPLSINHVQSSIGVPSAANQEPAADLSHLSEGSRRRASALLDIYNAAKQVINLQLIDAADEAVADAQRELGAAYYQFVARYGYINAKQNLKDLDRRSPLVPFLKALEEPAGKAVWKRAAIFNSRTIRPIKNVSQVSSPKDALLFCLNERGMVDLEAIAAMIGRTVGDTADALRGLIYETPSGKWLTAEEYLSGNVAQKLKEAQAAAAINPGFQQNVEALLRVQPAPLGQEEIAARLGSGWVPADVVTKFVRELVPQFKGDVKYVEPLGIWKLEGIEPDARKSIEATQTWGTTRMDALDLIEDGLNLRTPVICDEIYERWGTKRVVNDTETVAAQAKLTEIKLKFSEWVWSDEDRTLELCRIYNEQFNCLRERRFDGSHLQLPGMNSNIALRPHQKDGIWRVMQSRATLLGHVVGSGKTFLMIAAAMELNASASVTKQWLLSQII